MWSYRGQQRPEFAEPPGPGQESVWDYPRPPALVPSDKLVEVKAGGETLAHSRRCLRVLETASPPTYYIPPADIDMRRLERAAGSSYCEWKGAAQYCTLVGSVRGLPIGWSYAEPNPEYAEITNWICFYPSRTDCFVAGQRVRPQSSEFYGGWITDDVIGPFKGDPGTGHW